MNVINRRGRVLLDVYEAGVYQGWGILYSYRGPGMGGRGDKASLDMVIQCIKADHPSARIVGELPTPPTEGGHHGSSTQSTAARGGERSTLPRTSASLEPLPWGVHDAGRRGLHTL